MEEAIPPRCTLSGVAVLLTFALHNAWNCWMFLNFTNFAPAAELFNVSDADIGLITTAGWLGIISTIPVGALIIRRRRSMLFIAGFMNTAPAVVRYFAARYLVGITGYRVVLATNFAQGAAYGVFSVWPAIIPGLLFPPPMHATVTAIAALSNYLGGALGAAFIPAYALNAARLLQLFEVQAIVSAFLFTAMVVWLAIPSGIAAAVDDAIVPANVPLVNAADEADATLLLALDGACPPAPAAASAPLTIFEQLALIAKPAAMSKVATFAILIGITLVLQGIVQYLLTSVGFSAEQSGVANSVYQGTAAVSGIALGLFVRDAAALPRAIRALHAVTALSLCAFCALLVVMQRTGGFRGDFFAMIAVIVALGAAGMGMLPFLLQSLVHSVAPVSENVVGGVVYMFAILIAAAGGELFYVPLHFTRIIAHSLTRSP